MNYTDKIGNAINKGDIIFYSECIPYAESIHVIEEVDGVLYGRTVIGNNGHNYEPANGVDLVELINYCSPFANDGVMEDAVKVGNIVDNQECLTTDWVSDYHPLKSRKTA